MSGAKCTIHGVAFVLTFDRPREWVCPTCAALMEQDERECAYDKRDAVAEKSSEPECSYDRRER